MKKEVLFAILIGFAIGLLITFGIYQAQKTYQRAAQSTSPSPTPDNQTTPFSSNLEITFPQLESVTDQPTTTIKGITQPQYYITAVSNDYHTFSQADTNGNFSLEFNLEEGINIITLTSLEDQQPQDSTDLLITYTIPPSSTQNETDETSE